MTRKGGILVRMSDGATCPFSLSVRDVRLLDGRHFIAGGWGYRKLFGLDFIRGLKQPPAVGVPLVTHRRTVLHQQLRGLLVELETQRDLISFNYPYSFGDDQSSRHGGGEGGFRVEGGYGSIDTRPSGYCDLTISDVGPNGRGRVVTIIDMRVRRQFDTLDRGMLRVYRRKAEVAWFAELDKLIAFLELQSADAVEVLHTADA